MPVIGNSVGRRVMLVCILLLLQGSLLVVAGQAQQQCPNPACVAADYDQFTGTELRLHGSIISTDPVTMHVTTTRGAYNLTLTGLDQTPPVGARVVVYGTLRPRQRIVVAEFVAHPKGSRAYTYPLSGFAALLVAVLGVRYWTVDTEALVVRPRGDR